MVETCIVKHNGNHSNDNLRINIYSFTLCRGKEQSNVLKYPIGDFFLNGRINTVVSVTFIHQCTDTFNVYHITYSFKTKLYEPKIQNPKHFRIIGSSNVYIGSKFTFHQQKAFSK
jgi:hypothetical protein